MGLHGERLGHSQLPRAQPPLQQRIRAVIEEYTQEKIAHLGIDGCGAPVAAVSLTGLARAFSRLARAPGDKNSNARAATVATSMLDYPWAVQGRGEANTIVMDELDVIAKIGAEGVLAMATPQGASVAVKVLDGNLRATTLVGLTLLAPPAPLTFPECPVCWKRLLSQCWAAAGKWARSGWATRFRPCWTRARLEWSPAGLEPGWTGAKPGQLLKGDGQSGSFTAPY